MKKQELAISLRVKITGYCNMNCFFCHHEGDNETAPINLEQIATISLFAREFGFRKVHLTGGEPSLHKGLPDLVRQIKSEGLTCSLTTNGQFPDQLLKKLQSSRLDSCNFSFHTVDPQKWAEFQQHHELDYAQKQIDRAIANIALCQKLGIETKINTIVGDNPYPTINLLRKIGPLGVEIRLLDILGSQASLKNIDFILGYLKAEKISEANGLASSWRKIFYRSSIGQFSVKGINHFRLESICKGCQLKCVEGFYTVRVEVMHSELYVRLCLQRNDPLSLIKFEDFRTSSQLDEIITKIHHPISKEGTPCGT